MLDGSGLSVACYDATLIGWAALDPAVSGRALGASGLQHSEASDAARATLVTDRSWVISGDADRGTVTGPCVGAAVQIVVVRGDSQSATVGSAVGTAPSVRVTDGNGNPVAGVSVTFAVASGAGTVEPTAAVITGADGVAAVTSWTLGATAGSNTLTATASGLTGSPLTFTATGTAELVTDPDPDSDPDPAPDPTPPPDPDLDSGPIPTPTLTPGPGPTFDCLPAVPAVGDLVTCTVSGADPGVEILWRAAYNPVFASGAVRIGGDGTGTFSFTVPAAAVGEELRVELVGWTAPMSSGVVGGPVPSSVPAGEGPGGLLVAVAGAIASVLLVGHTGSSALRALVVTAFRRRRWSGGESVRVRPA
jgi:hypothetical protein